MILVYFVLGSSLGAVARFAAERFSTRHSGESFPYGTLFSNIVGTFILGWSINKSLDMAPMYFIAAFCGAFTTFGGFIGQTHSRWRHRQTRLISMLYLLITVIGSIAAAFAGIELGNF
jgi:CrcB protein